MSSKTTSIKNRIKGMMLGVAVGDALGMPVETFSPEKIREAYPETGGMIRKYIQPRAHKWFDGREAGTTTDDTQLTLAVARALIQNNGHPNMEAIADAHVDAFLVDDSSWGGTTRDAVRALANGSAWEDSGLHQSNRGLGNGVPMKIAPIAAYQVVNERHLSTSWAIGVKMAIMTHKTSVAVESGMAHLAGLAYLLKTNPENVDISYLYSHVRNACLFGLSMAEGRVEKTKDQLWVRMKEIENYQLYDNEKTIEEFNGGGCYCYDSVPFTYMFFARNYKTIDSLYDCVSCGGDADTNGSMLASMLGALHGPDIFPKHLIEGLDQGQEILDTTEELCSVLKID